MRAGLYQQKNGLLVFLGSLRSSKSTTCEEISSSTVFERSSVSGPSSLPIWFLAVPSEDFIHRTGRGGAMQTPSLGSISPGGSRNAGNRNHLHRRHDGLLGRAAVDVREAHLLHRVQVIEVAPELLEAVRRRQRIRMIAEVVLAELAGGVAEVVAGTGRAPACRGADTKWRPATAAGPCPRGTDACR